MSHLEPPVAAERPDEGAAVETVSVEGREASIRIPDDATEAEAAAVAAAVGTHLSDRQRAALAATSSEDAVEHVDQWALAARMRTHGKRRWRRQVERGNEWRAVARSF